MFIVESIKKQFPLFRKHPALIYLDSAATTQKPQMVIDGIQQYYENQNANIHRGIYELADKTTHQYEQVRTNIATWLNAPAAANIIFTKGTTDSINGVAQSFLAPRLQAGDNVVISIMEHHANFVPWQILCQQKGAELRIATINSNDEIDLEQLDQLVDDRTRMLACVHISNTLGTINPIERIIEMAHQKAVPVLIDGAQSAAHYEIDLKKLDCDFFVCSGHKLYGPTGIGLLYGKTKHLEEMQPWQLGGSMIRKVSIEETTFAPSPQKFEAGTPNIAGVIGLGYAVDFLQQLDHSEVRDHLHHLVRYAETQIKAIKGLRIIGNATQKSGILSFLFEQIHPHDVATIIDAKGLALRAGHHCTQPLMDYYQIPATLRASFGIYNSEADIDQLVAALKEVQSLFL